MEAILRHQIKWTDLKLGHRRIWLISDCHWNQDDAEYLGRTKDFERQVHRAWRTQVNPKDVVLDLGDVVMSRPGTLRTILSTLPGIKWLVRGNHDPRPLNWYMDCGYSAVVDQLVLGPYVHSQQVDGKRQEVQNPSRIVFNHGPIPRSQLDESIALCVHGHLHANPLSDYYKENLAGHCELFTLEHWKRPVLLKEFLEQKERLVQ